MKKKVLKFGGTSLGSIDRIKHAAKIIKKVSDLGNQVIVVVSAMSGKTNELISLSKSVSNNFNKRELDVLLSTGEQVSCALISGALKEIGINSKSFMNWQIPILTEGENNNARIINMSINKINNYLSSGGVAVVPGVAFGKSPYFRISYATSLDDLKLACEQIKNSVSKII